MEPFTHVSDSVANAAPVGGRRHKMKKASAKTIRRALKKMGLKPKGRVVLKAGGEEEPPSETPAMGGRRSRSSQLNRKLKNQSSTRRRSSFRRMLGL